MERIHSVQAGDIFKSSASARRILVVGLRGDTMVECRAIYSRRNSLGPVFPARVWRSVRDGSETLRSTGNHTLYCRDGRAGEPPARACTPLRFALAA